MPPQYVFCPETRQHPHKLIDGRTRLHRRSPLFLLRLAEICLSIALFIGQRLPSLERTVPHISPSFSLLLQQSLFHWPKHYRRDTFPHNLFPFHTIVPAITAPIYLHSFPFFPFPFPSFYIAPHEFNCCCYFNSSYICRQLFDNLFFVSSLLYSTTCSFCLNMRW